MYKAKTKHELIIEVWEASGRKAVGSREIIQIEKALHERFGEGAVDMPMRIARVLADAGARVKYPEIMRLDFQRRTESPYEAMFRNILKFGTLKEALTSIRHLENLRKNFLRKNDKIGLLLVKKEALKGKERALMIAKNPKVNPRKRIEKQEIAEWFRIYLSSPEVFENWIEVRLESEDFVRKFSKNFET
ncbi:MAG: hypothetical protein D6687_08270 [Acidobacteria bacterium]|jgi:hypothetical protein|nr:MAG: hypothetical protein D6687_08270 [Acidobacteriota bacterium]GIU81499.1 MAG: hypothetical protein KatS3mg006_0563 [Pyrinomonadaceae bacterium]